MQTQSTTNEQILAGSISASLKLIKKNLHTIPALGNSPDDMNTAWVEMSANFPDNVYDVLANALDKGSNEEQQLAKELNQLYDEVYKEVGQYALNK